MDNEFLDSYLPFIVLFGVIAAVCIAGFGGLVAIHGSKSTDDDCHIKNVDCTEKCIQGHVWFLFGHKEYCWFERVDKL